MNKKIVQDDSRQEYMIELFKLQGGVIRDGVDAYLDDTEFELKSTSGRVVCVARDCNYDHLEKWKNQYWLIGTFTNTVQEGCVFDRFYLMTPEAMQEYYDLVKSRLDSLAEVSDILREYAEKNLTEEQKIHANKIFSRGSKLGDPKIPLHYVRRHGIVIDSDHANELRKHLKGYDMTNMYQAVREFHAAFGQRIGTTPMIPEDINERVLRMDLLEEEFKEYMEAEENLDIVEIADALADIIYIACGTAVSYGIPLDKVFEEVHRSNMAKLVDGKVIRRDDGKIQKPEGWTPPNIKRVLDEAEREAYRNQFISM